MEDELEWMKDGGSDQETLCILYYGCTLNRKTETAVLVFGLSDSVCSFLTLQEEISSLPPQVFQMLSTSPLLEAYEDGDLVLYHSETYGRVVPAMILGSGHFYTATEMGEEPGGPSGSQSELEWPLYNCKVGVKIRQMVPMCRLQSPLDEGMRVSVSIESDGKQLWVSGRAGYVD